MGAPVKDEQVFDTNHEIENQASDGTAPKHSTLKQSPNDKKSLKPPETRSSVQFKAQAEIILPEDDEDARWVNGAVVKKASGRKGTEFLRKEDLNIDDEEEESNGNPDDVEDVPLKEVVSRRMSE